MPELTKDQAERLNRLNIDINKMLELADEKYLVEVQEIRRLLTEAERLSASILWGTK